MKRKIGINADCIRGGFTYGNIKKLRDAGFEHYFIGDLSGSFGKYRDIGESVGMSFDSIHAPFKDINQMWLEGDGYRQIFGRMKLAIDTAANHSVPYVVIHISSGWEPPETNELGFSRYDQLVNYAEEKRVTVAFENLRTKTHLLEVIERYKDRKYVRFCYDCGHEHCYTQGIDWIKEFGDKLACVHIHDNFGYDRSTDPDAHLIPFDGNIDYADMVRRLDSVGYTGPIMLEVFNSSKPEYAAMTEDEFFALCAERAKRIADM